MSKLFKKFLDRVDLDLAALNGYRNDDDLRLYLFCRLQTVSDHHKAKASPSSTAAMIFRQYERELANGGKGWWRFNAGL